MKVGAPSRWNNAGAIASQPASANRSQIEPMWSVRPKASCTTTTPPLAGPGGSDRIAGTSPSALAMLIASVMSASVGSGAPAISVHGHRTGHRAFGVIIGAMKAGTTTLFDHLASHPAVAPSRDKEPKYFARDNVYQQGPGWYASLWDWDPATHTIAIEASTHYSFRHIHPETAARMAAFPGEFRLVYLVRDPVARIESHYHHGLAAGWKVADQPLEPTLHPDLVEPCRYPGSSTPSPPRSLARRSSCSRSRTSSPTRRATAERVARHWDLPADGLHIESGLVRNSSSSKVVSTVHTARRLPGSAWLANKVSPGSRRRIKTLIGSGKPAPRLDAEGRAAVRADLAEDHQRLADEWGVDVSRWGADERAGATGG